MIIKLIWISAFGQFCCDCGERLPLLIYSVVEERKLEYVFIFIYLAFVVHAEMNVVNI